MTVHDKLFPSKQVFYLSRSLQTIQSGFVKFFPPDYSRSQYTLWSTEVNFSLKSYCFLSSATFTTPATMTTHFQYLIASAKEGNIKTFSKSFLPDPAKKELVLSTMRANIHPTIRLAQLGNPENMIQFIALWENKLHLLTSPILATDQNNSGIYIGSLSDEIDAQVPVSINGDHFLGHFCSLVPRAQVDQFQLPSLTDAPDTIEGAPLIDPTNNNILIHANPSMARLSFGPTDVPDQHPVFAAWPLCIPLPPGIPFTPGTLRDLYPDMDMVFPEFNSWRKAMIYLLDHNDGFSVIADGPLFNSDQLDLTPFANLEMVNTIANPFKMLTPASQHYKNVNDTIKAASLAAWTRIGSSINPVIAGIPQAGLPGPTPVFGAAEVAALVQGLNSNTTKAPTLTEVEQLSQAKNIAIRYALTFAKLIPNVDPHELPTVTPATLDPSFLKVISTSKNANAQRELTEIIGVQIRKCHASMNRLDAATTFKVETIDRVFTAAIQNFSFITTPINHDPSVIKSKIGVIHFAGPPTNCVVLHDRFINGEKVQCQELVGEDKTKMDKKATELYSNGNLSTGQDILHMLANLRVFFGRCIEDFDNTAFWQALAPVEQLLNTAHGKQWIDRHRHMPQIGCNLALDIQDICNSFFEIGNHAEYRDAVQAGNPIHPANYQSANRLASDITTSLSTLLARMKAGDYGIIPFCASAFPQLIMEPTADHYTQLTQTIPRKDTPKQSSPKKSNQVTPPPARNPAAGTRNDADKEKGFLVWKGSGRPPKVEVFAPKAPNKPNKERLCLHFMSVGLSCRFGENCGFTHPSSFARLPTEAQTALKTWVANTPHVTFAPGKGPSGTP
jgi:hypothetical protein